MRGTSAAVPGSFAALMLLLAGCGSSTSPADSGEPDGPAGANGGDSLGPPDGGPGTDGGGGSGFPDGGAMEAGGSAVDVSRIENVDARAGCGLVGAPIGALNDQAITVGKQTRTYVLSVPKSYDPSTPVALVFAWHGHGGTGFQVRQGYAIEPSAAGAAIFVYPNGATGNADWDYSPTGIDVALFDALVSYLAGSYCIDRRRIFSTGLSAGAYFTNLLGCYRGDVLRAIAPVAGGLPNAPTCIGHVGAWVAHAANDTLVDFTAGGVATRDFWTSRNGCSTALAPVAVAPGDCVEYQGCLPDLPVVWCVYTEGHTWPSMANCLDGGVCFDAGPTVWAFFARFS